MHKPYIARLFDQMIIVIELEYIPIEIASWQLSHRHSKLYPHAYAYKAWGFTPPVYHVRTQRIRITRTVGVPCVDAGYHELSRNNGTCQFFSSLLRDRCVLQQSVERTDLQNG